MEIGDRVALEGLVLDKVTSKDAAQVVSILLKTDDKPNQPGKEYWAQEQDLQSVPTAAQAAAMTAANDAATKAGSPEPFPNWPPPPPGTTPPAPTGGKTTTPAHATSTHK